MSPFRSAGQRPEEPPPVSTSEFEKTLRKKRWRMLALVFGIVALLPLTWFGPHAWAAFQDWRVERRLAALPENQLVPLTAEYGTTLTTIFDPAKARQIQQGEAFKTLWPQLIESAPPDEGRKCPSTASSIPVVIDNTGAGPLAAEFGVTAKADLPIESPHVAKLRDVLAAQAAEAAKPSRRGDHRRLLGQIEDDISAADKGLELVIVVDRVADKQVRARAFLWSPPLGSIVCAAWMTVKGPAQLQTQAARRLVVTRGPLAKRDPSYAGVEEADWESDVSALPIIAATPPDPLVVKRTHRVGQRYRLHLLRSSDGQDAVLEGNATVVEAKKAHAVFALGLEPIREGSNVVVSATALEIDADFNARPWSFDARELATRRAGLYLTAIETMFGDTCEPPQEPHVPGDQWTAKQGGTAWKMVGYDTQGGRAYASFEGEWKDKDSSWKYVMRLAVDDGFTGSCTSTNRLYLVKNIAPVTQIWTLDVKRLPSSADDRR